MLDFLYGLFYTAFSLAVVSSVALAVIMLIRLIMFKVPKKYIIYLWWLFLIRSICPISLSSIFSVTAGLNRRFHMFLENTGLSFDAQSGVMTGWMSVFRQPFSVTAGFRFCSIVWAAGLVFMWIYTYVRQSAIRKWLKQAKKLDENIYQHDRLNIPVMTGIFRLKKYLPGKMNVSEAKYTLKHMEIHEQRHDGVLRAISFFALSTQWFNPFMWLACYFISRDIEMAADEDTLLYFTHNDKAERYGGQDTKHPAGQTSDRIAFRVAQEILNMDKGKNVIRPSFVTFQETDTEGRAAKILYQNKIKKKDGQVVFLIALLLFVWWFMLRPFYMMWDGSYGQDNGNGAVQTEEPLFKDARQTLVAKADVKSADGLSKVIKLVMNDGEETDTGYDGKFDIVLEDADGNKIDEESLNQQFDTDKNKKLHFEKNITLHISDYNNDKISEVTVGQDIEVNDENIKALFGREPKQKEKKKIKSIQKYYMWNIEADKIQCISEAIYTTGNNGAKANSGAFDIPKGTKGVIKIKAAGKKIYYVWDGGREMFERKKLSKKQLKAYKKEKDKTDEDGESSVHALKDSSEKEKIRVVTKKDSTGSEEIKEIIADPSGTAEDIKGIKGYYCDIQWVQTSDKEDDRYAVLTYNGTKSQTFVVIDTKQKEIYYRQEDGNDVLSSIFKEYNGNQSDIAFNKDDIVVYTLQEKENNILKIGFAANAENNIVVKGSYKYDIDTKRQYEFSYTQTGAAAVNSAEPQNTTTDNPVNTPYAGN